MKSNELRIGNYIKDNTTEKEFKITAWHFNLIENNVKHINPIPLTDDWLLRFGFIYESPDEGFIELTNRIYLYINTYDNKIYSYLSTDFDSEIPISLTYVHQLQNLYFNLTYKELTIKESVL